jgi:hypothetical protein
VHWMVSMAEQSARSAICWSSSGVSAVMLII